MGPPYLVSQNEKIKVLLEIPTKEGAAISENGMISWKLSMKPGEKRTMKTKFSVTYPKGSHIRGLE